DREPRSNLHVDAAACRHCKGGVIETQSGRIVVHVDSGRSEQYVNERLNSLVLPQCELWAEQKQEFFKIRAGAESDRGIAEVTAEISLKREPSFEDGLSDRCVIPIQVPIVI